MHDEYSVDTIVTTYNRDIDFIDRAINSILKQTYKINKIIVVDDNGLNTPSQINNKEYFTKKNLGNIHYIANEFNCGVSKSRNIGIEFVKSDYIAFLDDDDEWLDEKIEKQIAKIQCDSEIKLVYCDAIIIRSAVKNSKKKYKRKDKPTDVYKSLFINNFIGSASFVLINKDVLEKVGYFDENLAAKNDLDLWIRIAKRYKIDKVSEPLVNYFEHDSFRLSTNYLIREDSFNTFYNKYEDIIENTPLIKQSLMASNLPYALINRKFTSFAKYFFNTLRINPFNIMVYKMTIFSIMNYLSNKVKKQ